MADSGENTESLFSLGSVLFGQGVAAALPIQTNALSTSKPCTVAACLGVADLTRRYWVQSPSHRSRSRGSTPARGYGSGCHRGASGRASPRQTGPRPGPRSRQERAQELPDRRQHSDAQAADRGLQHKMLEVP